ncbi:integral membrane protein TmpA [Eremomyces bilateralis CBS 781.70]|uniref:Integral membrane protein TmpA n=1 Tax=Eremomyces bilateralis CBS 781.70 TaxID=1392243 RepID=A0A6G1FXP5_9PEZI|nr:integral membrane protein TmpA [Eremomyces bilateralis CBS 781.70]KAF1810607.1 integral membrane protein TmpA [Eremomyces bilateralis CBS 781.70]
MEPSDTTSRHAPSPSDTTTIIVTPAPNEPINGGFSAAQFADYEKRLKVASPDAPSTASTVPEKRQSRFVRNIRHTSLNVYRRLFSIVFLLNVVGLIVLLALNKTSAKIDIAHVATAASANILVAITIRQDYVVNFMFRTCWLVPLSAPLRLRRMLAKIYEHGGVHSGAGVAGTVWLILLTVLITINFVDHSMRSIPVLTFSYVLLLLLLTIIVFAYPRFRFMSHNSFEMTHRFAGWTGVALFWVELLLIAHELSTRSHRNMGIELIHQPTFWFLSAITFNILLPWLRLRKWTFRPEVLSNHALRLHYDKTLKPFSGLAISDNPLFEWHPFATFPAVDGAPGGSMIISDAGDWTKSAIMNPQTKYWVKGLPKTGVLSMACIFRNVVVVTTGSGIGPCLSFLTDASRRQPARVLWSTPSPLRTFGQGIVDAVRSADSEAVIIDTRASGRPNMVEITYRMYVESGAEAVFVISNPRLTRKIVYSMESRGVPAFGPVWDS